MKQSIYDYDVIGFDMDFALIEYDFIKLMKCEYEFMIEFLENMMNYPKFPNFSEI